MKMILPLKLLMLITMTVFLIISGSGGFKFSAAKPFSKNIYRDRKEVTRPAIIGPVTSNNSGTRSRRFFALELTTIVMGALLIFGGTWYYRNNKRQFKKQILLQGLLDERSACLGQVTEERDWLIKEIHHRVKNTLQIVMSLLNTQLSYLDNKEALQAISNSQHRMFAISLIHQKLYQTESLSHIDMEAYIPELLEYLSDALDADERITCKLTLAPLSLDVSRALPLGLILNEAVSNALKFAYPGKDRGEISLILKTEDQQHYTIDISDNGIGLNNDMELPKVSSFGQTLMEGLTHQLGGSYQVSNKGGVSVHIAFKKDE
ncbi:sensor histidine kinase [Mucilaginibacter rigui]|uniref:histidine kinase n=1 Tax=Mucilaginibacter rigui TaxID=534635 RepID=A0ABR7X5P5_9SPHI|nr:sensor histidine kinase [Mucilaginibacter rigui]MBD1385909.1 sensor histidine kinase [Mucilaginibacter rigui]